MQGNPDRRTTMLHHTTRYGFGTTVALPFEQAIARTKEELAREGFGVLSEIDVAATLKKKLGVDFPPYVILGACNPPLAHRALTAEREIGLLLPCNVIVYTDGEADRSVVAIMDPETALSLTGNATIAPLAHEVSERLQRVIEALDRTA
jgi:uncharacterized protein (DUF302 family)